MFTNRALRAFTAAGFRRSFEIRPGAPAGFQARVGKIRREAPKIFFRWPTLVFSLPTLPYVTVAHPAHRTEANLKEKASLATNQEGPPPLLLSV